MAVLKDDPPSFLHVHIDEPLCEGPLPLPQTDAVVRNLLILCEIGNRDEWVRARREDEKDRSLRSGVRVDLGQVERKRFNKLRAN